MSISPVALAVLEKTSDASFAAEEFFEANISSEHTRRAYARIVGRLLMWCEERGLALHEITRLSPENTGKASKAPRRRKIRPWPRCGISSTRWSGVTPWR